MKRRYPQYGYNAQGERHWTAWTVRLVCLCVAASAAGAQGLTPPELDHADDEQHVMHSHEPLILDATLTWQDLIETTVARFPRYAELAAHQAEADALVETGSRWFADTPAVFFSYLSDSALDNLDQREYGAGVELPLWRPGQRRAARGLGDSVTAEAAVSGDVLRLEIAGLLRTSLWAIAGASNAVELAEGSVEIAAELVRVVERRRESGDLPLSDELLARSTMLEKQIAVIDSEAELLDAERAYRSLTGLDERPISFSEPQTELEDFDEHHPLLALANAEINRARASAAVTEGASKGTPLMSIGPYRERGPLGTFYSDSLTLAITLPIGGKRYGGADRAQAARRVAEAESQRAMLLRELDLDLHEAEHELFVIEQSLDVAAERTTLAERQWQMGQTAFEQGEIDLRDLLLIQEFALTTRREVAHLEIQRQRMIAMLNQALGELP